MIIKRFLSDYSIIRYLFSGAMGFLVNISILYALTEIIEIYYIISGIIAFSCAVIASFFLQKRWTFNDHSNENVHRKFIIFTFISVFNLVFNTYLLYFFTDLLHFYYLIAQAFASIIIAIWSFFAYKMLFNSKIKDSIGIYNEEIKD